MSDAPKQTHQPLTYPLASPGIFHTIQGEGELIGLPMTFVRFGGCSVGCHNCDTDYRTAGRKTAAEIVREVRGLRTPNTQWTWITGGEPADHNLWPLIDLLCGEGRVALAISGHKSPGYCGRLDFLSVSPHGKPETLQFCLGTQVNLVPGLGGLNLDDWKEFDFGNFKYCYVTPLFGSKDSLTQCVAWVNSKPGWKLGVQAHKQWGLA